ncbi:hypothetical protein AVEN_166137-1, partial [Araneus ventricosus]
MGKLSGRACGTKDGPSVHMAALVAIVGFSVGVPLDLPSGHEGSTPALHLSTPSLGLHVPSFDRPIIP